jgi:tetratricopeptide (TPR) repeat protein
VDAWAELSRALTAVYTNGSRDPVVAARAREAMERAIALDPNGPQGYAAAARYYGAVDPNPAKASAAIERALRVAPNDADILAIAAGVDSREGRIESATLKLERAREIDPRSASTLVALQQMYVLQRRYQEARDVGQAAMALVPGDINIVEWQAMGYLGQGDLKGAREVVRAAIDRGNPAPAVAAFFGGYQEVSWALEDAERQLLLRLTPAAFDNDRAWWGQTMAIAHWQQGNANLARAYADSALPATAAQAAASPTDGQTHALHALMLAFTGKKAEAIAEGKQAVEMSGGGIGNMHYSMMLLIRTYLAVGEPELAMDQIEDLLQRPYLLTRAWLRIDPTYRSLRGNPRFERILQGS